VIPIRDETQTCVAISGRSMSHDVRPKYLHSRFKRNRVLYGEDKVVRGRVGFLCEGFFHVMWLHQLGYANAVARMGTALSTEQAQKLVTYFTELVIIPDGDAPGRASAEQISLLLKNRINVRVVSMPDDRDIDGLSEASVHGLLGSTFRR
jgi:DNA primase